jgi:hypothetical protein
VSVGVAVVAEIRNSVVEVVLLICVHVVNM